MVEKEDIKMSKLKRKIQDGIFLKLTKTQTILLGFGILLLIALIAGIVLVVAGGGPTITSVDGKTPDSQGNITNPVSLTPTLSGKAPANSLVSVYQTPMSTQSPTINQVAGDPALSATYIPGQPAGSSPGPFMDNFDQGIDPNIWDQEGVTSVSGTIVTNANGPHSRGVLRMDGSKYSLNLNGVARPLSAEVEVTVNQTPMDNNYWFSFYISKYANYSTSGVLDISIQPNSISYGIDGGAHGVLTTTAPVIGQKMKLRIEMIDTTHVQFMADTNMDGTFEFMSGPQIFTPWTENTVLELSANNQSSNPGNAIATWDNLVTNFPAPGTPAIPAGYLLSATGMNYNGIDYQDPAPFAGNAPGICLWGDQGPVALPATMPAPQTLSDLYVYLTTLTVPAGAMGNPDPINLHLTWYFGSPDQFANIVAAINGQGMNFVVDAYTIAYTASGTNLVPTTLPTISLGSIIVQNLSINYTWPPYLKFQSGTYSMSVTPLSYQNKLYDVSYIDNNGNVIANGIYVYETNNNYFHDWAYQQEPLTLTNFDGTKNINAYLVQIGSSDGIQKITAYSDLPYGDFQNALSNSGQFPNGDRFIVDYVNNIFIDNGPFHDYTFNPNAIFGRSGGTISTMPHQNLIPVINPPSIPGILIAKAIADASGNWTAIFGKDEKGVVILSGDLSQFGSAPYKIFVQTNGVNSDFIVIQSVSQDADGDGVNDNADLCPTVAGKVAFDGCPSALYLDDDLHIIYQGNIGGYAGIKDGKQKNENKIGLKPGAIGDSRNENIDFVQAKLYKLTDLQAALGSTGLDDKLNKQCGSIFDNQKSYSEKNLTVSPALYGVPGLNDYVIAIKIQISDPVDSLSRTVALCKKVDKSGYDYDYNNDKIKESVKKKSDIHFIKTVKDKCDKNNPKKICVQLDPADEQVFTGSELSVIYPQSASWEEGIQNYAYPYIFTSDSDWSIDVCASVPAGYKVVGVYDETGQLISDSSCTQALVANTTKIVAFEVSDIGSPKEFNMESTLKLNHAGKIQSAKLKSATQKKTKAEMGTKSIKTASDTKDEWKKLTSEAISKMPKTTPTLKAKSTMNKIKDFIKNLF